MFILYCLKTVAIQSFFYIWRVNWRWYIPLLLLNLAFFGVRPEPSALANQEIVVQFTAQNVSASEANLAISRIASQLKSIGVAHIAVSKIYGNKLKVTYFSTNDIATVKDLFNGQGKLQIEDGAFPEKQGAPGMPFEKNSGVYKLDVIKLQDDYYAHSGLQGLPVTVKSAKDNYLKPIVTPFISETGFCTKQLESLVTSKNYRNAPIFANTTSHIIPEVRAGPLS